MSFLARIETISDFKADFLAILFLTEKSPVKCLSELFFRHYSDLGHTYFGNQGLKPLNAVVKSKEPYKLRKL